MSRTVVSDELMFNKQEAGRELMRGLYTSGLFRTWLRDKPEGWELVSGLWSPFYIQLRHLSSYPSLLSLAGGALAEVIRHEAPDVSKLVGIATGGIPLSTAVSLASGIPMGYTRKLDGVRSAADLQDAGQYGEHALVEGKFLDGDRIALIDDVAAMFSSKDVALAQVAMEARHRKLNGIVTEAVVVAVEREQGAAQAAAAAGVELLSLVKLRSEGLGYLKETADARELEIIEQYLSDPHKFQGRKVRESLEREARQYSSDRASSGLA